MAKKRIPKKIIKIVKSYTERIAKEEKTPIKKVIIFGSQVKGKSANWSDIDVCIISSRFKDPFRTMQFLLKKRRKEEVMAGLEPIGFTEKDFQEGSSLIEEIKKTGIEVK